MQNKIKKYIKIIFIVIIAIIINISVVYASYVIIQKNEKIEKSTVKVEIAKQSTPIVIEVPAEGEKENKEDIIIEEDIIEKVKNYPTGKAKYYLKVNIKMQTVTVFEKDENDKYSIPIKVMVCSTGTDTPKTGTYNLKSYRKEWLELLGDVYGKYCTQIVGDILFHSVPYLEKGNSGSLEYWEYDKLGQDASKGCIRLTVENAKWIFENCEVGTKVEFSTSEESSGLEITKPAKISDAPYELRNWDPTDNEINNPWIEYNKNIQENEKAENVNDYNEDIKIAEKFAKAIIKNKKEGLK